MLMSRSITVLIGLIFCSLIGGEGPRAAVSRKEAAEIHRRAIVVDGHSDTIWWVVEQGDRRPVFRHLAASGVWA